MGFVALTEAEIAPDKPVSNDLLKKVKDNFDDHEARILSGGGGGGSGGIGEVLNGSFESDSDQDGIPDNWTRYLYAGGSSAFDLADSIHGKWSYKFVHPGGVGNGGGYLESDYIAVSNLFFPPLPLAFKTSVSGIKVQIVCRYYAADANGNPGTYLGERTLWTYTTGTSNRWYLAELKNIHMPYANAKYIKYRLIGGHYDTNVAGSVWFDGVGIAQSPAAIPLTDVINQAAAPFLGGSWQWVGGTYTITIPTGLNIRYLAIQVELYAGSDNVSSDSGNYTQPMPTAVRAHINTNQVISTVFQNNTSLSYLKGYVYADISSLSPGTHSLRFQGSTNATWYWAYLRSQNLLHYFTSGKWLIDAFNGIVTESYL